MTKMTNAEPQPEASAEESLDTLWEKEKEWQTMVAQGVVQEFPVANPLFHPRRSEYSVICGHCAALVDDTPIAKRSHEDWHRSIYRDMSISRSLMNAILDSLQGSSE